MPHHSRLYKVVIDVPDEVHDREVEFWQGASGETLKQFDRYNEYHGAHLHGQEFALLVQRLGEGQARVHLDIHTDDLEAEVARLERLGAERVRKVEEHWWIMRDPAGLPFCVLPDTSGTLNE
ncbi:VOC family protein, partial [Planobispora siamensis]